jgi:taurine dioxygenase
MDDWKSEASIRWRPLAPFGAEIDIDLARPLSPEAVDQLTRLVWDSGMVIARGQALSMARQRELLALLGPILLRSGETGYLSAGNGQAPSVAELKFHADAAYTDHPFDALSLRAMDVVDGASSTRFVNAETAFVTLPAALREHLETHRVEMISPHFETLSTRTCDIREPRAMRRSEYPGISVNPNTGRECIRVSEMHAARVLGMSWEESRALLHAVYEHLYAADKIYEHFWHRGDIVIWDNNALQHSRGSLAHVGTRVLQRVIVGVEVLDKASCVMDASFCLLACSAWTGAAW